MVDISGKLAQIRPMIDQGLYFTINRARQYGKTTILNALRHALAEDYICARISFQGLGDESFESVEAFCPTFLELIERSLRFSSVAGEKDYISRWVNPQATTFKALSRHLTSLCEGRRILLMIDEADAFIGLRTFIGFLGVLRDKYLDRNAGVDFTFHSVILAGVCDIKNIKMRMIKEGIYTPGPQEDPHYISPWNIASDFNVDMSFHPKEIVTMLAEYEKDHRTGMNMEEMSEEIYYWTNGYPFLVSRICMLMDEDAAKPDFQGWTKEGVFHAVRLLLWERNTLFADIFKNMERYPELYQYIYDILIRGAEKRYASYNPTLEWALMFAFVKVEDGLVKVSNRIFEMLIADYFLSIDDDRDDSRTDALLKGVLKEDVVRGGRFDMELALRKFAVHFRKLYTDRDAGQAVSPLAPEFGYAELHNRDVAQWRLIFLSFLAPLLNGDGFYHIESQLTNLQRMDLVVNYARDEFIIELKLWRGEGAHEDAYGQLAGYLASRGATVGYLVTFDLRQPEHRTPREEWVEAGGCRLFDVVL